MKKEDVDTMAFTDVDETRSDLDAINYVVNANLMGGYPDGSFQPDNNVQWGEFCKILAEIFASKDEMISFLQGHWALGYAEYCKRRKLLPEKTDTSPEQLNKNITDNVIRDIFNHLKELLFLPSEDIERTCSEVGDSNNVTTRASLARVLHAFLSIHPEKLSADVQSYIESGNYKDALMRLNRHQEYGYYEKYKHLLPPDISHAYDIMYSLNHSNNCDMLSRMIRIKELKQGSFCRISPDTKIFHYTSLDVLKKLIQPEGRLRLSPIAYLNDPKEGSIGIERAQDIMSDKEYRDFFSNWGRQYLKGVFIASFILHSEEDEQKNGSIPMWENYGDRGKGCAITVDVSRLGDDVYKVYYQSKNDPDELNDELSNYCKALSRQLDEYLQDKKREHIDCFEKDPVFVFAKDSIEQVCYLYKTSYYTYEKEARIVQFLPLCDAKRSDEIQDGEIFPRIYSELKKPLKISSVILGPKVVNPERVAVALANQGIDTEQIYLSTIPYR